MEHTDKLAKFVVIVLVFDLFFNGIMVWRKKKKN